MKKTLLLMTGILFLISACGQQDGFQLSGTIEGLSGSVRLLTLDETGAMTAVDSADVSDGTFTFTGTVPGPQMAQLEVDGKKSPRFFLENADITLAGDTLTAFTVTGSRNQAILDKINEELALFNEKNQSLYAQYNLAREQGDQDRMNEIRAAMQELSDQRREIIIAAAKENTGNAVGPYYVYRQLRYSMSLPELQEYLKSFKGEGRSNVYFDLLQDNISTLENVAIGKTAPDFEMENPDGELIKLSDFRGNYLLIDFWAAWCGPCRRENPNVVKLYNEVKGKNFEILGVSLDRTREDWLRGIEEDGLTWPQVSDLQFWDNRVAKLYGVSSIPHTVLLDKEGVIIEKNLRGEALREKVLELVN